MFGCKRKNTNCCGNGIRKGGGRGERKNRYCISLSEAVEDQKYIIRGNPDKQIIDMGIAPRGTIFVHKNNIKEANLIVGVGEIRLIIPRKSAERIKVK